MTFTLSQCLQSGLRALGQLTAGKATSGTTTTVVDSTQANRSKDNVWKDGALFLVRKANGSGAAPEGEFQRISGSTNSSGTYTLDTALSAAAGTGDVYAVASPYYPLQQMIQCVNDALSDMGDIDLVDTTTLTSLANTSEYAAAVAWKRAKPYRIDLQGRINASADNQWETIWDWDWIPALGGTAGKIIFRNYQYISRAIRIWYKDAHPGVYLFNDAIYERFEPNLVVAAFVNEALDWQNKRSQGSDDFLLKAGNKAAQDFENLKIANPMFKTKHKPRLLIVGPNAETSPPQDLFQYPPAP